jgi:hypothetical protein
MMTTVASPTLSPTWLTMTPDRHADTVILRRLPGGNRARRPDGVSSGTTRPGLRMRPADAATPAPHPSLRASGKGSAVLMRRVRDTRLFDICRDWLFSAVNASPGARALYQHRRGLGDGQEKALRRVGNKARRPT